MKVAYFNCFAGISGDMILGALIDAGLDKKALEEELGKLKLAGYSLEIKKTVKKGICGTKVDVLTSEEHAHRHLKDIREIIDKSDLSLSARKKCNLIFERLAEAEAHVHNTTKEKIHFHEVGSMDAIVDVVGSVCGLELLGIEKLFSSPLHVGSGFTKCAHGTIPLPAPATLQLLKGIPVYSKGIKAELVTPTGAAIITALSENFGPIPPMSVQAAGYGGGTRDLEIPNLLGIIIGEDYSATDDLNISRFSGKGNMRLGSALMVEVNVDDMNPEFFDYLFYRLLSAGAQDVFLSDIQMKKNRPGTILNVLISPDDIVKIAEIIFNETTTIGFRTYPVSKYMLPYEVVKVKSSLGEARVKIARMNDTITTIAPEYEDCRLLAEANGVPLKVVYDEVKVAADNLAAKMTCKK